MINNDTAIGSTLAAIGLGGLTLHQLIQYASHFTVIANSILAAAGLMMLAYKLYRWYRREK